MESYFMSIDEKITRVLNELVLFLEAKEIEPVQYQYTPVPYTYPKISDACRMILQRTRKALQCETNDRFDFPINHPGIAVIIDPEIITIQTENRQYKFHKRNLLEIQKRWNKLKLK